MKKIMILAISAVLAANVCAHEQKQECKGKQFSQQERVEMDIHRLTQELYLSDQQAANFAVTYREYAAEMEKLLPKKCCHAEAEQGKQQPPKELSEKELDQMAKERFAKQKAVIALKEKYYDKFRKDLNARQVEKVLRLNEPFGPKPCGGKCEGHGPKPGFDAPKPGFDGPKPGFDGKGTRPEEGPQGHPHSHSK